MDEKRGPDGVRLGPHPTDDNSCSDKIEHVSDILGSWGPFQKRLFIILCFIYAISPFSNASLTFYAIKSDFWCDSVDGVKVQAVSKNCNVQHCDRWVHNTTRNTLIKEWDLVCDKSWLVSTALSSYQLGYLVSGLLIGFISDRYGRRVAVIVSIIDEIVCFFALSFAPSIYVFIFLRCLAGVGGYGRYLSTLLMLVETVGSDMRGTIVVAYDWIWNVGVYVMTLTAFFVEDFRHLYFGVACYQVLSLIFAIFYLPESIRWQLVTNRTEAAKKTLTKNLKFESVEAQTDLEEKLHKLTQFLAKQRQDSRSESILDIWKVPRLLKYCLALYGYWFVTSFMNHGLSYNLLDLSGNYFINKAIIGSTTFLATFFLNWRIEKINRKRLLSSGMASAAIAMFLAMFVVSNHDYIIVRNALFMVVDFALTITYLTNYVYTSELFPTPIRQLALGSCSVASRIGSISAPFTMEITRLGDTRITLAVFALFGLLGACLIFLLPETRGKEIPDTVKEMIEMTEANSKSLPNNGKR